jgi:hypothetical protein
VVATLSITEQLAEQARNDRKRKERLFEAAKTFARKVTGSTSIHEVALMRFDGHRRSVPAR